MLVHFLIFLVNDICKQYIFFMLQQYFEVQDEQMHMQ